MGVITHFGKEMNGPVIGSSWAEPDGTEHEVDLLSGDGKFILRIKLQGSTEATDLMFSNDQAVDFTDACEAILRYHRTREKAKH